MDSPSGSMRRMASRPAFAHSPAYPSPAQSDSDQVNLAPDGLGLYGYTLAVSTSPVHTITAFYPPSPQPTEAWGPTLTCSTSPNMTETADAWPEFYDQGRSPLNWTSSMTFASPTVIEDRLSPAPSDRILGSHRTSISSHCGPLPYDHDGADPTLAPKVKIETQMDWLDDGPAGTGDYGQPLTLSPDRLSTSAFSYGSSFQSPVFVRADSGSDSEGSTRKKSRASSLRVRRKASAQKELITGPRPRRRSTTNIENAQYECHICGTPFQRKFNHKAHMETHNPEREKPHVCPHENCDKRFVRKTDLERHEQSVHIRSKKYGCEMCDRRFPRKDTLKRHVEDGCPRRWEVRQRTLPSGVDGSPSPEISLPIGRFGDSGPNGMPSASPLVQEMARFGEEGYASNLNGL